MRIYRKGELRFLEYEVLQSPRTKSQFKLPRATSRAVTATSVIRVSQSFRRSSTRMTFISWI